MTSIDQTGKWLDQVGPTNGVELVGKNKLPTGEACQKS